jgi:hypothetical protein
LESSSASASQWDFFKILAGECFISVEEAIQLTGLSYLEKYTLEKRNVNIYDGIVKVSSVFQITKQEKAAWLRLLKTTLENRPFLKVRLNRFSSLVIITEF